MSYDPSDPFGQDDTITSADKPIRIQWDYRQQIVVGDDMCTLFDTTWSYYLRPWRTALRWQLVRSPGDALYLHEEDVPEMVRLAVMVSQ